MARKRFQKTGIRLLMLTGAGLICAYQSLIFWQAGTNPHADPTPLRVQFYIWLASTIVAAVWWTIVLVKFIREGSRAD
jgi:hypothetical protein